MQGFHACCCSCTYSFMNFLFFFYNFLTLDSFLKWQAAAAADHNPQYISSSATFSCNVMTCLCFLGTLPVSLVVLCTGPMMLFRVYDIALINPRQNTQEPWDTICSLLGRRLAHAEMIALASHRVLSRYSTCAHCDNNRTWLKITVVQDVQLILCSWDLNIEFLCLFTFLSTVNAFHVWSVRACVCKFW